MLGIHPSRLFALQTDHCSTKALGGGDSIGYARCCLLCCLGRERWTVTLLCLHTLQALETLVVTVPGWIRLRVWKPVQLGRLICAQWFADSRLARVLATFSNLEMKCKQQRQMRRSALKLCGHRRTNIHHPKTRKEGFLTNCMHQHCK